MKDFITKNFSILIIAVLAIIIFLQRSCTPAENTTQIVKVTDTAYIPIVQTEYRPGQVIYVDKPIFIPYNEPIDTPAIIRDYFSLRVYKDTLRLKDTLGYIAITDSIYMNKIKGRIWDAHINKQIITETITIYPEPKGQLYAGGSLGMSPNLLMIGGDLIWKTKKDQMYGVGVGVNSSLQPYIQFRSLWKIKFKK